MVTGILSLLEDKRVSLEPSNTFDNDVKRSPSSFVEADSLWRQKDSLQGTLLGTMCRTDNPGVCGWKGVR